MKFFKQDEAVVWKSKCTCGSFHLKVGLNHFTSFKNSYHRWKGFKLQIQTGASFSPDVNDGRCWLSLKPSAGISHTKQFHLKRLRRVISLNSWMLWMSHRQEEDVNSTFSCKLIHIWCSSIYSSRTPAVPTFILMKGRVTQSSSSTRVFLTVTHETC